MKINYRVKDRNRKEKKYITYVVKHQYYLIYKIQLTKYDYSFQFVIKPEKLVFINELIKAYLKFVF